MPAIKSKHEVKTGVVVKGAPNSPYKIYRYIFQPASASYAQSPVHNGKNKQKGTRAQEQQ